jgi:hypothetical protein
VFRRKDMVETGSRWTWSMKVEILRSAVRKALFPGSQDKERRTGLCADAP